MLRASAVSRDLLSHKQDADASVKPIDVDADCHAVRVFPDLMWKAADEVLSNPDAWTNRTVLDLAIKFEAPVVRERAIRRFDMLAVQKPWDTFCAASSMLGGDVKLAKKAIKHITIEDITINTPQNVRARLMKRPLAHALSVHEAAKCTLPFLIGLYRACGVDVFEDLDWEIVAQRFIPATAQGEAKPSLVRTAKS